MLIYILSNSNQTLGVFSSLNEAQNYYNLIDKSIPIKLEECRLNSNTCKDMTIFLKYINKNIVIDSFDECDIVDSFDECDMCGGEDCKKNGECCNVNYD